MSTLKNMHFQLILKSLVENETLFTSVFYITSDALRITSRNSLQEHFPAVRGLEHARNYVTYKGSFSQKVEQTMAHNNFEQAVHNSRTHRPIRVTMYFNREQSRI